MFLLFGSRLVDAVNNLVSFTTDFGVEAEIGKTGPIPLQLLCPFALPLRFETERAEIEEDDEPEHFLVCDCS